MEQFLFYPQKPAGIYRPNSGFFFGLLLMFLFAFSPWQQIRAQNCDCPFFTVDNPLSIDNQIILPSCTPININTSVINSSECTHDLIVKVFFGTDIENFDYTKSFNYTGNIQLLSTDFIGFGNILRCKQFTFLIPGVPSFATATNTFSFLLDPQQFFIDDNYFVGVEYSTNTPGCTETIFEHSFITVEPRLVEPPISGTVTSLIGSQRLLPNSSSNPLVELKTIHGVLDVNTSYWFDGTPSNRAKLYLEPGAEIIVRSGSTLTLSNLDLFTCDQLAKGIVVEAGGTLVVSESTLKDCRYAIDARPGSTISVTNTSFLDNYIGLQLDMTAAPEASKRVTITALNNNVFSTESAAIKTPYAGMPEVVEARGFCGIRIIDYRDFNVWTPSNSFRKLANGLLISKSTFNIGNMHFDDMHGDGSAYSLEGFGIHMFGKGNRSYWGHVNEMWHSMTFNNCKTGIYAFHYSAQVDNTVMTNVVTGIDWSSSQAEDIKLRWNNIKAKKYGIRSYQNEPMFLGQMEHNTIEISEPDGGLNPVTGIEMQEVGQSNSISNGWKVTSNTITMKQGGRGILYKNGIGGALDDNVITGQSLAHDYKGIHLENSAYISVARNGINQSGFGGLGASFGIFSVGGVSNTFSCNCIDNTNVGIQFYGSCDFSNKVRGNSFNHHITGLRIGDGANFTSSIGIQSLTGNQWDLAAIPLGQFGALCFGNPGASMFRVNGQMGQSPQHPAVNPAPGWFLPTSGTTYYCTTGCAAFAGLAKSAPETTSEGDVPTEMDLAIAANNFSNDQDVNWQVQYNLYRKLLHRPELLQNAPELAKFKAVTANLALAQLAFIAEERSKLFAFNTADQAKDEWFRAEIALQTTRLLQLDSLRQTGTDIKASQYNHAVQLKSATEAEYADFLDNKTAERRLKTRNLLALNAATRVNNTMEINHKTVNTILLNLLLSDDQYPSESDLATLSSVADQCPTTGGDAVFEARAIIERLTEKTYDDANNCPTGAANATLAGEEKVATEDIKLFPNPTSGLLEWTGTAGQSVTVRVFNQLGLLVKEQTVDNNRINLNQLPDGLYLIQISGDNGAVWHTQKCTLMKH